MAPTGLPTSDEAATGWPDKPRRTSLSLAGAAGLLFLTLLILTLGLLQAGPALTAVAVPTRPTAAPSRLAGLGRTPATPPHHAGLFPTFQEEAVPPHGAGRAVGRGLSAAATAGPWAPWALCLPVLAVAIGGVATLRRSRAPASDSSWSVLATLGEEEEEEQSARRSLLEELESPYRKVRYFLYAALGGAAGLSAFVELPRLVAALNGINVSSLPEAGTNLGVSAAVLAAIAFFFQRDRQDELKRLDRIKVGAALSALRVQFMDSGERFRLADLRQGRGRATRVVLVAAPPDLLRQCLATASTVADRLVVSDLLLVPIALPLGTDPIIERPLLSGEHVAVPAGGDWAGVIRPECDRAREQGLDPTRQGFTLVVKKNGRVGQRIAGLPPLARLAEDVEGRRARGMDVDNI